MLLSNNTETPLTPPFNANTTLGAVQIGVLVSTCLFGVVTVQAYIYSSRFPKDPRRIKFLVCASLFATIDVNKTCAYVGFLGLVCNPSEHSQCI